MRNKYYKNKILTTDGLEGVIVQRLKLATNQRVLADEFGVKFADLSKIKDKNYLQFNYKNWPFEKKRKFVEIIGGPINRIQTENFINKILGGENV